MPPVGPGELSAPLASARLRAAAPPPRDPPAVPVPSVVRQRVQRLFAEYGIAALVIHYVVFGVVFAGAWVALRAGWRPASLAGKAGLATMAYAVVKLTMPVRLAVTAALVPVAARAWERLTGRPIARPVPEIAAAEARGAEGCPIAPLAAPLAKPLAKPLAAAMRPDGDGAGPRPAADPA